VPPNWKRYLERNMTSFLQVVLRTQRVDAARKFYAAVLGGRALEVVQLHEQAVARGARPHWLGMLQVADVAQTLAEFVARGATALSPVWQNPEGLEGATLRDPGGAVLGLAKPPAHGESAYAARLAAADVIGYSLNTEHAEHAKLNYAALFGWEFAAAHEHASVGTFFPFAFEPGGSPRGTLSDIAGRPGVHPHWLLHFRVDALEPAREAVRAHGGTAMDAITLPDGSGLVACDDDQGAAFALRELAPNHAG
jgi:predicted enzyme related to lactoylglutathione lyase